MAVRVNPPNEKKSPIVQIPPTCRRYGTRSISAESTSIDAEHAITSIESTTRNSFFRRSRIPSAPRSGPRTMHQ
jgi:hypothetical protein